MLENFLKQAKFGKSKVEVLYLSMVNWTAQNRTSHSPFRPLVLRRGKIEGSLETTDGDPLSDFVLMSSLSSACRIRHCSLVRPKFSNFASAAVLCRIVVRMFWRRDPPNDYSEDLSLRRLCYLDLINEFNYLRKMSIYKYFIFDADYKKAVESKDFL